MSRISGDLSEDIKSVIEQYLEGHRSRSLATLSRSSGVSYTTLRRLFQREGHPTAEPVLKIVDATLNNDEKIEFLNRHYPEIADAIKVENKNYDPAGQRSESIKTFLFREPHNFILNLAHNDRGTTREDVKRLAGDRGVEALDELLEHELLQQEFINKRAVIRRPATLTQDADMTLGLIKHATDHFDRSLVGTKAARAMHTTGSVNQQALERIHDVVSNMIKDVLAIKNDPESGGDIPIFVSQMMNVYDRTTLTTHRSEK